MTGMSTRFHHGLKWRPISFITTIELKDVSFKSEKKKKPINDRDTMRPSLVFSLAVFSAEHVSGLVWWSHVVPRCMFL